MDRNENFKSCHFLPFYYFLVLNYVWKGKIWNISTKFGFLPYFSCFSFFSRISSKIWIWFRLLIKFSNCRHLLIFHRSVSCKILDNCKSSKIVSFFEKMMIIYQFPRGNAYPSNLILVFLLKNGSHYGKN